MLLTHLPTYSPTHSPHPPHPLTPPHPAQASKLRVKPASIVSRVEVLPPGTFGTGSTRPTVTPRQLPAGNRTAGSGRTLPATATTVSGRRALPSSTGGSQ